jgi:NTP pyrophosphatase (non-canonical NTP hydrolase)
MRNSAQLGDFIAKIRAFCEARDWSQFHDPKNLAISLQLEASEVLELFQWTQDNKLKPGAEDKLAAELADVFYWTLMLADKHGIDLAAALDRKMVENEAKYPVDKAKGSSAKYTDLA